MIWVKRVLYVLAVLVLAQWIYAKTMGAIYGQHCTLPDEHWWGSYRICWANLP